jgi:hypothetical protein
MSETYERSSPRFLVVNASTKKLMCECIVSKTKIDVVFEIPKTFTGALSIIPKYESLKGSEITVTLSKAIECYDIITDRINHYKLV